jgi:hypothetical protein
VLGGILSTLFVVPALYLRLAPAAAPVPSGESIFVDIGELAPRQALEDSA